MIVWVVVSQNLDPNSPEHPEVLGVFSSKQKAHHHFFSKVSRVEGYEPDEWQRFDESTREWLASPTNCSWWEHIREDVLWSITPRLLDSHHTGYHISTEQSSQCAPCARAVEAWAGLEEK
jgi:hypothetical protein